MTTPQHPPYIGFAGLMRKIIGGTDIPELGPQLEGRTERDPGDTNAMMDLATVLFLTRMPDYVKAGHDRQLRALHAQQVYVLPPGKTPAALRVLAIAGPGDLTANTPLDCLLEESDIEIRYLYLLPDLPLPAQLPEHDVVFVTIGESELGKPLLQQLQGSLGRLAKPIVNRPAQIAILSRDWVANALRDAPGIEAPATIRLPRQTLETWASGAAAPAALPLIGAYPILIRPLDSHGGKDLAKLDDSAAVAQYLQANAQQEFYITRFVDYSRADGQFRKFRVVMTGGVPYACHMAISTNWMIHYVNADMDQSAAKRAEEEAWMDGFEADFAVRHRDALAAIQQVIGLDYYGIDCAETSDGKLLIFEIDNAMIVHNIDDPAVYPYKDAHMRKLFAGFRAMLLAQAGK